MSPAILEAGELSRAERSQLISRHPELADQLKFERGYPLNSIGGRFEAEGITYRFLAMCGALYAQDVKNLHRPFYLGEAADEIEDGLEALGKRFFPDNPASRVQYILPDNETRIPSRTVLELIEKDVSRLLRMNNIPSGEFLA